MKNKITYLWEHEPFVSSPPCDRILHHLYEGEKEEIDEIAVFKLQNEKFLFIRFYGTKKDLNMGFTDLEEFDSFDDAKMLYESMFVEKECEIQKK